MDLSEATDPAQRSLDENGVVDGRRLAIGRRSGIGGDWQAAMAEEEQNKEEEMEVEGRRRSK